MNECTEEKTITTVIYIPYCKITNEDICIILKREIEEKYKSFCDLTIGYIEEVKDIVKYSNTISRVYNTVNYNVTFTCNVVYPVVGKKISGTVIDITPHGALMSKGLIQMMAKKAKDVVKGQTYTLLIQSVTYNASNAIFICIGVLDT